MCNNGARRRRHSLRRVRSFCVRQESRGGGDYGQYRNNQDSRAYGRQSAHRAQRYRKSCLHRSRSGQPDQVAQLRLHDDQRLNSYSDYEDVEGLFGRRAHHVGHHLFVHGKVGVADLYNRGGGRRRNIFQIFRRSRLVDYQSDGFVGYKSSYLLCPERLLQDLRTSSDRAFELYHKR